MPSQNALSDNFAYFFSRLNPSGSFEKMASSEHQSIIGLIENPDGPAARLQPRCFLQGSYKQDTAIYTINDVDIVALCQLQQPGSRWSRDRIFETIAAPLLGDKRYRDKVRFDQGSMCIKVVLGIKVEILPVMFAAGNTDLKKEPFRLYRPQFKRWDDGYARTHQRKLTLKNSRTGRSFKPMIKVMKHLRSYHNQEAVSFHLECLLYQVPDSYFQGNPSSYIPLVLYYIASRSAKDWYNSGVLTPCRERNLFSETEWNWSSWKRFHGFITKASKIATKAYETQNRARAIEAWQTLLGSEYFPKKVSK
jgi:hypothetical protein